MIISQNKDPHDFRGIFFGRLSGLIFKGTLFSYTLIESNVILGYLLKEKSRTKILIQELKNRLREKLKNILTSLLKTANTDCVCWNSLQFFCFFT